MLSEHLMRTQLCSGTRLSCSSTGLSPATSTTPSRQESPIFLIPESKFGLVLMHSFSRCKASTLVRWIRLLCTRSSRLDTSTSFSADRLRLCSLQAVRVSCQTLLRPLGTLFSPGGPLLDNPRSRLLRRSSSRGTLPKNLSSRPSLTALSGLLASNLTPSLLRFCKLLLKEYSRLLTKPHSSLQRARQPSAKDLPTSLLSCKTSIWLPGTTETFTGQRLSIGKTLRIILTILTMMLKMLSTTYRKMLKMELNT